MASIDISYVKDQLCEMYKELGAVIDGDSVKLQNLFIKLSPGIYEQKGSMVTMGYFLSSPVWGSTIVDTSASAGSTDKEAVDMNLFGLKLGLMDSVIKSCADSEPRELTSEYLGKKHRWKAYTGNIVAVGPRIEMAFDKYWQMTKDKIATHIGNQKMCAVKIFLSNNGEGKCFAECRINNIPVGEIGEELLKEAKSWKTDSFISHKQYFILRQDKETTEKYPVTEQKIFDMTRRVLRLYEECNEKEEFDKFAPGFDKIVKDKNTAAEIIKFIPELCAEHNFRTIKYPDTIALKSGDKEITVYKTQLFSYSAISNSLFSTLDGKILNNTEKIYDSFVRQSSLFNAIAEQQKKGEKGIPTSVNTILYNMPENYEVR